MAKAKAGSNLDHVKQGSALLNQLMNLNKAGQNSSSGAGDSLARVGESITDKDPVSSAVSGLMSGIGAGMKVSEANANRKSMEGMEESIMALMRENNEVAARNQQIEQEQAAQKKLAFAISESAGGVNSLLGYDTSTDEGKAAFNKAKVNLYQGILNTAGMDNISISPEQDTSIANVRVMELDPTGKPTGAEENIYLPSKIMALAGQMDDTNAYNALKAISDQIMQAEPLSLENQRLKVEKQKAENQAIAVKNQDKKWDPETHGNIAGAKAQAQSDVKTIEAGQQEIKDFNAKLSTVKELRNLLDSGKIITGNTLAAKAKRLFGGLSGNEEYSATEMYDAAANTLFKLGLEAAKFGNMNEKEFEFLLESIPKSKKTKQALYGMLDRFESVIAGNIQQANDKINALPNYRFNTPSANPNVATNASGAGMVRVKLPNGQTGQMPLANAQKIQGIEILS